MNPRSIHFVVAAAACLLVTGAQAQVKTDGEWRGLGGASLATSSGNTSSSALLLNTDMARATTADKITLGGSINYAKAKINGVNQTTANKWGAAGQYDYNLSPHLYAFGKP